MNTPTPTPRTDMATYPADRLGATLVTHRDCARALERELTSMTARAERAEAALADWSLLNLWGGTPEIIYAFVKGQQVRIHYCQELETDLTAERARLDSGQILLTVAGERVWHSGVDLRAAIDAGMREGAK